MRKFKLFMLCSVLSLMCSVASAQTVTATGKVMTDDGFEAIGATVKEKGVAQSGVVTVYPIK